MRSEVIGSWKLVTRVGGLTMGGSPPKERGTLVMKANERANESGVSLTIGLVTTSRSANTSDSLAASTVFAAAMYLLTSCMSCGVASSGLKSWISSGIGCCAL